MLHLVAMGKAGMLVLDPLQEFVDGAGLTSWAIDSSASEVHGSSAVRRILVDASRPGIPSGAFEELVSCVGGRGDSVLVVVDASDAWCLELLPFLVEPLIERAVLVVAVVPLLGGEPVMPSPSDFQATLRARCGDQILLVHVEQKPPPLASPKVTEAPLDHRSSALFEHEFGLTVAAALSLASTLAPEEGVHVDQDDLRMLMRFRSDLRFSALVDTGTSEVRQLVSWLMADQVGGSEAAAKSHGALLHVLEPGGDQHGSSMVSLFNEFADRFDGSTNIMFECTAINNLPARVLTLLCA